MTKFYLTENMVISMQNNPIEIASHDNHLFMNYYPLVHMYSVFTCDDEYHEWCYTADCSTAVKMYNLLLDRED